MMLPFITHAGTEKVEHMYSYKYWLNLGFIFLDTRVQRLSGRSIDWSKTQFYPPYMHLAPSLGLSF